MRRRAALAAVFLLTVAIFSTVAAEEEDLYETLGVPKDASKRTIKKEYYRLARAWHPDKHPGDAKVEARFKKISRAYEVLSDDTNRERYDQFGHRGLNGDGGGGGGGGAGFHSHFGGGNSGFRMQFDQDMFRDFFSGDGGFGGGGFGGGFGGGGGGFQQQYQQQEEQPRERVCHYNKICGARGCKVKKECKTF